MKCLVFQPNNCAIEIILHHRAYGQDCLIKVCNLLDVIEINFFGLQYYRNGQPYWLVLRKRINQQMNVRMKTIRLYLKVKFYVLPHHIQQNATKHQFYLNICHYLETKVLKIDPEKRAKLIALIAQIEYGDFNEESYDLKILYSKWISILYHLEQIKRIPNPNRSLNNVKYRPTNCDILDYGSNYNIPLTVSKSKTMASDQQRHCDSIQQIIFWHQRFLGYSSNHAKSLFLKEALEIDDLGVDYFTVTSNKKNFRVGIGPRGITISSNNNDIKLDETNLTTEQKFRIYSEKDYYQFYRLLAEKRAFYSLPMIDQTIVPSRFNSNFSFLNDLMQTISTPSLLNIATSKSSTIVNKKSYEIMDNNKSLCKICLNDQICMAFIPCGHTSCEHCCLNIKNDVCPFCKCEMKSKQKIFL
ncbi:Zinc ion binding [Dermatophagoides farinae]|uniref:Zinc ion binding n=1 Tax=Dermatophagoides farinae TaxID=6954 RepID=A0A922LCK7_DERFA|nr:Zinc ion binding [Dermatophagoides farinae]